MALAPTNFNSDLSASASQANLRSSSSRSCLVSRRSFSSPRSLAVGVLAASSLPVASADSFPLALRARTCSFLGIDPQAPPREEASFRGFLATTLVLFFGGSLPPSVGRFSIVTIAASSVGGVVVKAFVSIRIIHPKDKLRTSTSGLLKGFSTPQDLRSITSGTLEGPPQLERTSSTRWRKRLWKLKRRENLMKSSRPHQEETKGLEKARVGGRREHDGWHVKKGRHVTHDVACHVAEQISVSKAGSHPRSTIDRQDRLIYNNPNYMTKCFAHVMQGIQRTSQLTTSLSAHT
ncbi:hypothetical protein BHE74_00016151 [Ensete ventricosum]|nr:hypothetical protein BHE74_00016151 [Ensete ventricosum]RZS08364.1 hypothetical protein BHM03_00039326 [Ensete ventricosum]